MLKFFILIIGLISGGGFNKLDDYNDNLEKEPPNHLIHNHIKQGNNFKSNQTIPETCSGYQMLRSQPALLPLVTIPKCCEENSLYDEKEKCVKKTNVPKLEFELIYANFYEGCIEDRETSTKYEIKRIKPCSHGLQIIHMEKENSNGEMLYILSNGSLLVVDLNWFSYSIYNEFCIDTLQQNDTYSLYAAVCDTTFDTVVHVTSMEANLSAIFMSISVPCLVLVAFIYIFIPKLSDLHGKSLSFHCICLAVGYLLLGITQFTGTYGSKIGFWIQYFILAAFLWLLMMVIDIAMQVWYYLPKNIEPKKEGIRLLIYLIISQCMPLIVVLFTYASGYHGLPSYYFRATSSGDLSSQKFFIPVVSSILCLSIIITIGTEIGYRKLSDLTTLSFLATFTSVMNRQNSLDERDNHLPSSFKKVDGQKYNKVKIMKISTTILLIIMCITWTCEIISFFSEPSKVSPIVFFDIINALQGVFIFMLFVCLPKPFRIIVDYFKHDYDEDDEEDEKEEMAPIKLNTLSSKELNIITSKE